MACISPVRIKPVRQVEPVRVNDFEGELERIYKGSSPHATSVTQTFAEDDGSIRTVPVSIAVASRAQYVPCGKCNYCLERKRADWSIRLSNELKRASFAQFLTLTYEDSKIPLNSMGIPELCKRDVQLFTKRLRKVCAQVLPTSPVRYYTVGEYGTETCRPHYHSIMFGVPPKVVRDLPDIWSLGHVYIGTVTPASIHYVTKYVINRDGDYDNREAPFALMSKRPGIGADYLRTHTKWHKDDNRNYTQVNGVLGPLPRYYRDRIFTKLERARMASESIQVSDQKYFDDVADLIKFHSDPYAYYDERFRVNHDRVPSKVNSNNKF